MDAGVTINRPPRDGHMAFIRTPDSISIELLQKGGALPPPSPGRRCRTPGLVTRLFGLCREDRFPSSRRARRATEGPLCLGLTFPA